MHRKERQGGGERRGEDLWAEKPAERERERQKHREYKSSVQTPNRGSKTAGMKEALKWEEQRKRKGGNDGLEKNNKAHARLLELKI